MAITHARLPTRRCPISLPGSATGVTEETKAKSWPFKRLSSSETGVLRLESEWITQLVLTHQ